ncbi:hypothetical protein IFM89_012903, partial [Coptis chinensis]
MAEVVVSPIVDFILPKLTSLIGTDSRLPNDLKNDLKKVSKTFSIIRLVLDDAEKKQIKDKSIRSWLRMVKDAAYEAEDIIDDCALEFHCPESEIAAYEAEDIIDDCELEFHCRESETLNLQKCRNLKMLPKNLSKMRKLIKLVIGSEIYIRININDPMLTHMPLGIGELTCLKQLRSSTALPKLTQLGLYNMPNVEGWSSECLLFPSCLQRLHLYNCPKLKLPTPLPSSITRLSVGKGNDPSLKSVEKLPNLSHLRITEFDEVETLPEAPLRNLTRLQVLEISNCDKLKRLPTELENLSGLIIWRCRGLESLTEGLRNLTSLEGLRITTCGSLKSLSESSLQHLTALQMLRIWDCPELEIMSVDFQHLISLRDLELRWLPQLTSLPEEIQHARRLRTLDIRDCKNLRKLPEWLLELPALTLLRVVKCHPELHRRCEDWNRIPLLR